MTAEELDQIEVWVNDHYRPCTDEWARMMALIREIRSVKQWPDSGIPVLALDEFTRRRKFLDALCFNPPTPAASNKTQTATS